MTEATPVKKTRFDRFKQWTSDNADIVVIGATTAISAVGIVLITLKAQEKEREAIDRYNDWADKENEWLDEQHSANKDVYWMDGSYLVLDKDTPREIRTAPQI